MTTRDAEAALRHAVAALRGEAAAVLVRRPLLDPRSPNSSDLDLLVFDAAEGVVVERLPLPPGPRRMPRVDLIRLPAALLLEPERMARYGLIAHRLLSSEPCYYADGQVRQQCDAVRALMYEPAHQLARLAGFLEMGGSAVREIGVTRDVPGLCLFWLHIAHAACVAALLDASRALCPNVYTRPLDYWEAARRETGVELEATLPAALRLDVDPHALVEPLRRMHALVSRRFPEPEWPPSMREDTRSEYRYFLSPEELNWRVAAAREMAARGQARAAVHYLRFWAYALACIPLVHARAREGVDVSFLRPQRAMGADLREHCPELLDDLAAVLGGRDLSIDEVQLALTAIDDLRRRTLEYLQRHGFDLGGTAPWRPFETRVDAG